MSSSYDTDLAIIGAGQAGLSAALLADRLGARVTLIEANKVGGSYLWRGIIPLQTLAQSGKVHDIVQRTEEFGVHLEKPRVVWTAVRLRIADIRDTIRAQQREALAGTGVQLITGKASFVDPHEIAIDTPRGKQTITARTVILATGSQCRIPSLEGLDSAGYVLIEQLFDRPNKPHSLLVLGNGPRAAELAQAFQRLGTKVTLVSDHARLLPDEDSEVSETLERILSNEGVEIHLGVELIAAGEEDGKKWVEFKTAEATLRPLATELAVIGEPLPFHDGLNLEAAGVDVDGDGVRVTPRLQTSTPHIFACGHAVGREYNVHISEYEARVAVRNALLQGRGSVVNQPLPYVTFTDPEVARVGLTAEEAIADLGAVRTYEVPFSSLHRATVLGETSGFARVITSNSGRILGVHVIGTGATEILAAFVPAVREGALLQEFADAIYPTPTLATIAQKLGLKLYDEILTNRPLKYADRHEL